MDPDAQAHSKQASRSVAANLEALQKSTVIEKIMLYFTSRMSRNAELKATIRSQFEFLLQK